MLCAVLTPGDAWTGSVFIWSLVSGYLPRRGAASYDGWDRTRCAWHGYCAACAHGTVCITPCPVHQPRTTDAGGRPGAAVRWSAASWAALPLWSTPGVDLWIPQTDHLAL